MDTDPQLVRELFDLPGAGSLEVVSVYRNKEADTSAKSQEYGRRCMAEGDYLGAIFQFRRALDQCKGSRHELLLELGAAYESAGQSPFAYRIYKRALKMRESGELLRGVSGLLQSYGKSGEAVQQLNRATELEPGNAYNHFRLAEQLRKMGHPKTALEAIAHAISYSADDAFYHYWMGDLLLEMGRYEEAVQSFAAAEELSPGDDRLFQLSGLALWGAGKRQEAIRAVRLASDLNSEDLVNYALLEVFLRESGQETEAALESRKARQMDPYDRDLLERLLQLIGFCADASSQREHAPHDDREHCDEP